MQARNISETSMLQSSAICFTASNSKSESLTVNDCPRLSAIAYSGQFQRLKAAKHSPQIITATPKYMSASGMAQPPKPLTVNQQAQPKKNPARNSDKTKNCLLLASFSQQAIKQDKKEVAKKMKVKKPIGHELGIRRLRWGGGGGYHCKRIPCCCKYLFQRIHARRMRSPQGFVEGRTRYACTIGEIAPGLAGLSKIFSQEVCVFHGRHFL